MVLSVVINLFNC